MHSTDAPVDDNRGRIAAELVGQKWLSAEEWMIVATNWESCRIVPTRRIWDPNITI